MIALAAAVATPVLAQPETAPAHVRTTLQSSCTSRPTMLICLTEMIVTRKIWSSSNDRSGDNGAAVGEK